jgi:hypothetical protein
MKSSLREEEILNAFDKVLPYMPYFFEDEISVALTDKTVFLRNQVCESLPLELSCGDLIPEGGAAADAIKSGKVIVREVSKDIYGSPFKSYAVPLKNQEGKIVGTVLVARNLQRSKNLLDISKNLTLTFGQITNAINELSEDIQNIAMMNNKIADASEKAAEDTDGTNVVLSFIQKIASQSNLLGLNASIEAARVGDAGKGFKVVAQEIRKMSVNTTDYIKKISMVLNNIEDSIHHISNEIKESNVVFHAQIAILEEIAASMIELSSTVQILEELSEQI